MTTAKSALSVRTTIGLVLFFLTTSAYGDVVAGPMKQVDPPTVYDAGCGCYTSNTPAQAPNIAVNDDAHQIGVTYLTTNRPYQLYGRTLDMNLDPLASPLFLVQGNGSMDVSSASLDRFAYNNGPVFLSTVSMPSLNAFGNNVYIGDAGGVAWLTTGADQYRDYTDPDGTDRLKNNNCGESEYPGPGAADLTHQLNLLVYVQGHAQYNASNGTCSSLPSDLMAAYHNNSQPFQFVDGPFLIQSGGGGPMAAAFNPVTGQSVIGYNVAASSSNIQLKLAFVSPAGPVRWIDLPSDNGNFPSGLSLAVNPVSGNILAAWKERRYRADGTSVFEVQTLLLDKNGSALGPKHQLGDVESDNNYALKAAALADSYLIVAINLVPYSPGSTSLEQVIEAIAVETDGTAVGGWSERLDTFYGLFGYREDPYLSIDVDAVPSLGKYVYVAQFNNNDIGVGYLTAITNQAPVPGVDPVPATTPEDTPIDVDVLTAGGWSDPEGDNPLTVSGADAPSNGTASVNPDGTVHYVPNTNFNGGDTIVYRVQDATGKEASGTIAMTVTPVEDAPVAFDAADSMDEDTLLYGYLSAFDADNDALTYSVVTTPLNGTVEVNADGSFVYQPILNFNGTDTFTFKANDGQQDSNAATVSIDIRAVNDPPQLAPIGDRSVNENATVGIALSAQDVDGDALSFSVTGPGFCTLAGHGDGTASLDCAPGYDDAGTYPVTVRVTDNGPPPTPTSDQKSFTLTVVDVNRPPSISPVAAQSVDEQASISIAVAASDPDGNGLSLTAVLPGYCGLTDNGGGTGVISCSPGYGDAGVVELDVTATDDGSPSLSATTGISLTVIRVNRPPVANDDVATMDEDQVASIDVLQNDTDPDGDLLTIIGASVLAGPGTVTIAGNQLSYDPGANANGSATLQYAISDGNGGTSGAEVAVTINPVNDAPVANSDAYVTDEDTVLTASAAGGVLANDTDVDGDTLTATLVSGPAHGTLNLAADGSFSYTPAPNYNGADGFSYRASDGSLASNIAIVSISVTPVNDPPTAVDDAATVIEGNAVTVSVLANDTDVDGDTLSVSSASAPNGSVTINADNSVTYMPNAGFSGTDTVTYTATDGNGGTASAALVVTVQSSVAAATTLSTQTASSTASNATQAQARSVERQLAAGHTRQALDALDRYERQLDRDIASLDANGDGVADDPANQASLDALLDLRALAEAIRSSLA